MRELGAVALTAGVLLIAGCESTKTVTVATSRTTATTSTLSGATVPGWGGATTSLVLLPLPFDSEENAFMGNPDPQHGGLNRTGCFAAVTTFDSKSEEVCDCAYRQLRGEGHPASQLAAVASSVTMAIKTQTSMPAWFGTEITRCWADLDGGS